MLTTILSYVRSHHRTLKEARRVDRHHGRVVIGIIDRGSELGREYINGSRDGRFLRNAHFFTSSEIIALLRAVGCERMPTF